LAKIVIGMELLVRTIFARTKNKHQVLVKLDVRFREMVVLMASVQILKQVTHVSIPPLMEIVIGIPL
jgi:hypothetical protein